MHGAPIAATLALLNAFRLVAYIHGPVLGSDAIHHVIGEPARMGASQPPRQLKVVTWNIEYGTRFDGVLRTLRAVDADVYILQEVDLFCRRSGNRNVAKDLADALGLNWIFAGEFQEIGLSTGHVPALTGQAILSRYPIAEASAVPFRAQAWARWHLNPVQPRRGDRTVLIARTAGLRIYNAHLESGGNDWRRGRQLDDILADSAEGIPSSAVLLAGDFNNNPIGRTEMFAPIGTANFVDALGPDADRRRTCDHHPYPIDWLFVRHARSLSGRVLPLDHVSDHYPVMATLQLDP